MGGKAGATGTYKRTPEMIESYRRAAKARCEVPSYRANLVARMKACHASPEWKEDSRRKRTGQKRSADFCAWLRERAKGNSWHLGHRHSEASKRKTSLSRKGKTAREKNPNWKGGTSRGTRSAVMTTADYRNWRKDVFARDNYTCVDCGTRGVYLQADHIKWFADHPDLRFDVANGRTLCVPCHKTRTAEGHKSRRVANFSKV